MYKYLMFDLDGTLIKSGEGITGSARYTIAAMGKAELGEEELLKFIGPPLYESFVGLCKMTEEEAKRAVAIYREHYEREGYALAPLYEGITEVLEALKAMGKTLMIVTSKPYEVAEKIVEQHGLYKYFVNLTGPTHEEITVHKDEMIRRAFEKTGITNAEEAVMIGDRKFDIEAANRNGVDSIAVLYGYGNREEFEREGATFIVETCEEIVKLISK